MPRRMSVALTLDAVRERRKTVTRRKVDTWRGLEAGDRLTLVEKGMGLPKGSKQVVVAEVEIVDVRVQLLSRVDEADVRAEGFTITPAGFARFWLDSHGYRQDEDPLVRRIEWRYLEEAEMQASSKGSKTTSRRCRACPGRHCAVALALTRAGPTPVETTHGATGSTRELEPMAECSRVAAVWCDNCGQCSCPPRDTGWRAGSPTMDDPSCPLHAPSSRHGEIGGPVHPDQGTLL